MVSLYYIKPTKENNKVTFGKLYKIVNEDRNWFYIEADNGELRKYKKTSFSETKPEMPVVEPELPVVNYRLLKLSAEVLRAGTKYYVRVTPLDNNGELDDIDDLHKFLGVEPTSGVRFSFNKCNSSLEVTKDFIKVNIGKYRREASSMTYPDNTGTVRLAYEILKELENINKFLVRKTMETKLVYLIEHAPNSKKFTFASNDKLEIGEAVYCHTSRGLTYGVVVGTAIEPAPVSAKRAMASKINRTV